MAPHGGKTNARDDWAELARQARERWTSLTDDDLAAISGDRERLIETLEERYPRTREVIEREVTEFYESAVEKARRDPDVEL